MAHVPKKTILIVAILMVTGLPVGFEMSRHQTTAFGNVSPIGARATTDKPPRPTAVISPWRLTSEGWQDSSKWPIANPYVPRQTIERLHPLVWSGTVLFAVIAIMIWASSEWEIARLFDRHV